MSSSDSQRNIFENKSLEETCRLGGQGVLPLPEDYAAIKLTLPTCLSATATYLLHHGKHRMLILLKYSDSLSGVNAPGLFRISGQNSVVNELYGYYAFQFGSAGSPTKVQATVQPGVLPIHIPYNLADVSTLFKKIVKEFPGGLLGSLETFDAIRNILLILDPDPVLNHEEVTALRAKLIALTILSISSPARYNLVQALLGLFAYFGDEAEAARWNGQVDPTQSADKAPSTELMGYQALGVCLGPLLLGDLIENLEGSQDETEHGTAVDGEESIKVRKKRHSLIQDKLSTPAHFASIVDCANLTANIMQLLLMIWRDVVKQLSALIARDRLAKGTLVQSQTPQRPKTGRRSTRHSVKVTGEELLFLDMMRGGSMTVSEQPYNVVVKKEFTAKGRSSMPRIVPQSSGNLSLQREWFHDWTRDAPSDDQKGDIESGDGESTVAVSQHKMMDRPSSVSKGETRKPSGTVAIGNDTVVQSQEVPAQVASREDEHTDEETMSYAVSPSASRGSPIKSARFHRSSRSTPDAGSLSNLEPEVVMNITSHRRTRTNDNPLSITKRGLPPPPIEPAPHQDQKFPPRHSSLEKRQPSALRSNIEMVPKDSSSDFALRSAKLNDSLGPEGFDTSLKPTIRSFSSSAPVTGHGAITKDSAPKFALPVIPPFSKPASASSAPAKFPDCTSDGIAIKTGRSSFIMAPTRPLSAYTLDSLRQLELDFQQSDLACQIDRPLSREVSRCSETPFAHAEGVRYRSDSLSSSQARKVTNSTLFAEITRLKRQLEQKEDIVAATRRSLEAARMGREEGPSEYSDEPRLGSWSKGTLSAEIRDLKNQRDAWKHRAEWAEKRLKGVEEMGAVENSWTSKDNAEVASKYRNAHSDLDEVFFA